MTAADHANRVREALNLRFHTGTTNWHLAVAALDALQTQAERNLVTEALARNAQVHIDGALKDRQRAEAAEAERDHARDALRQIANWPFDTMVRGDEDGEIKRAARAALGDKP